MRALKPEPQAVKVWLDDEDLKLLDEDARHHRRERGEQAAVLLSNAVRSAWAYGAICNRKDTPAVEFSREFFGDLFHLQEKTMEEVRCLGKALEEIQRAGEAGKVAAGEAAKRCELWLDVEKGRRDRPSTGPKVIVGKFRPVPKGAAS